MKQTIETQVRQMLKDYLGEVFYAECGEISAKSNLQHSIGLDSFDIFFLFLEIEKNYNLKFSAEDETLLLDNPSIENFVNVIYKNTK